MGGEKSDEGRLSIEAKGVVIEVDGVKVRKVEDRCEQRRQGLRDFVQETACEDIGQVCYL